MSSLWTQTDGEFNLWDQAYSPPFHRWRIPLHATARPRWVRAVCRQPAERRPLCWRTSWRGRGAAAETNCPKRSASCGAAASQRRRRSYWSEEQMAARCHWSGSRWRNSYLNIRILRNNGQSNSRAWGVQRSFFFAQSEIAEFIGIFWLVQ